MPPFCGMWIITPLINQVYALYGTVFLELDLCCLSQSQQFKNKDHFIFHSYYQLVYSSFYFLACLSVCTRPSNSWDSVEILLYAVRCISNS